jgi:branched-chain amino acid transport system permease protein
MAGINRQKSFVGGVKNSFFLALWFMFLTFPIMVIRVNTIEDTIEWRWLNMVGIGVGVFFLSFAWRYLMERKEAGRKRVEEGEEQAVPIVQQVMDNIRIRNTIITTIAVIALLFPFIVSTYQVNIMITALMYVMLGLGLNIVVGVAGLLDLGYVAFYLVGAYAYALLNYHYGLGFWVVLPIGGLLSMICGVLLGFPVLRLRGDYLAIVTLGFGEIIRLIMENWNAFSFGPSGISNIPRPGLLGVDKLLAWMGYEVNLDVHMKFLFFLMILLVIFTIFMVNRLQNSRIGRAWLALREDEIACQAMGIDKHKTKLTAFALGATWAGMAGVISRPKPRL